MLHLPVSSPVNPLYISFPKIVEALIFSLNVSRFARGVHGHQAIVFSSPIAICISIRGRRAIPAANSGVGVSVCTTPRGAEPHLLNPWLAASSRLVRGLLRQFPATAFSDTAAVPLLMQLCNMKQNVSVYYV